MLKQKYRNQSEQVTKNKVLKILIFFVVVVLVLLCVLALVQNARKQPKYNMELEVKEVLENFECTFLKMRNSREEGFVYDIYTNFKYDLFENDVSQEEFYGQVIAEVAKRLQYQNFRLLDENKREMIEIKVICLDNKVQKVLINGIEDYFIYRNSQKNLEIYTEIKNTELSIDSVELLKCMENDWNSNIDFGTRETIFQSYYIYFDEGIETRKIGGKIYNIIFTKNYAESVVNGFTVGTKRDIIERELGTPTFENDDGTIIGYKNDELYIFFGENQISIYENRKETNYDAFFELTDKFLNEEYSLLQFMNELTYLWPDYEKYVYDANTVFLSYPNKGIDIKINYDNTNGIVLYHNIGIRQEEIKQYLAQAEFVARLQVDNIYNAELRRVEKVKSFAKKCEEYEQTFEKKDKRNRGNIYHYYMDFSTNHSILCVYFISQNAAYPNCELSENIKSYIWGKEDYFIYSVEQKGIYYYDLRNQSKGTIITGKETFEIKSFENGMLSYDDKMIQVNI